MSDKPENNDHLDSLLKQVDQLVEELRSDRESREKSPNATDVGKHARSVRDGRGQGGVGSRPNGPGMIR